MKLLHCFYKYGAPQTFYSTCRKITPISGALCALLLLAGLIGALWLSPADYQQKDAFRIIYMHVPSAWMSMFVYMVMAATGAAGLIWKVKVTEIISTNCAPPGAAFTFLALVTGSIWGKPMWGTWWVWDARLTSELVLLFLYLGYMALQGTIEDRRSAAHAGAILALVGLVNIPIIHYSVIWWNTLHQGPTLLKLDAPSIHISMLIPLLIMMAAYMLYFLTVLCIRSRHDLLALEKDSSWAKELRTRDLGKGERN